MRQFLWSLTHPIQTFKIMVCKHTQIDMDSFKCSYCGKQFRIIKSKEYSGYLKENNSLEWEEDETGHFMKVNKNGKKNNTAKD